MTFPLSPVPCPCPCPCPVVSATSMRRVKSPRWASSGCRARTTPRSEPFVDQRLTCGTQAGL